MPAAAAIAVVGSVAAGAMSANATSSAAKKAAKAQTDAANQANATDLAIYQDQRNLLIPSARAGADARARQMLMQGFTPEQVRAYLTSSNAAFDAPAPGSAPATQTTGTRPASQLQRKLADAFNIETVDGQAPATNTPTTPTTGASTTGGASDPYAWVDNYNWQTSSPSYAFRVGEGQRALERSAAARGRLFSGATGMALERYGQDMGSQEFEADYSRLGGLAGDGTNATGTVVNIAGDYGNNVNANNQTAANARSSAYQQIGAANSNFWGSTVPGGIGSIYGIGSKQEWFG